MPNRKLASHLRLAFLVRTTHANPTSKQILTKTFLPDFVKKANIVWKIFSCSWGMMQGVGFFWKEQFPFSWLTWKWKEIRQSGLSQEWLMSLESLMAGVITKSALPPCPLSSGQYGCKAKGRVVASTRPNNPKSLSNWDEMVCNMRLRHSKTWGTKQTRYFTVSKARL